MTVSFKVNKWVPSEIPHTRIPEGNLEAETWQSEHEGLRGGRHEVGHGTRWHPEGVPPSGAFGTANATGGWYQSNVMS